MEKHLGIHARRGSATIESAIVLPVFLAALLTLSSLIGYPVSWLRVETAMRDTARLLASGGYAAELCGLLAVRGDADSLAQGRTLIGKPQLDALSALLAALTASDGGRQEEQASPAAYGPTRQPAGVTAQHPTEAGDVPAASLLEEIRMACGTLSTDLGSGIASLSDEVLGQAAFALASWRLSAADGGESGDPWVAAGIRGGKKAVSFSGSHYDSASGQIELVADYSLKPAAPFGMCPAIRCRNRVRVALWGAGVGRSLRGPYASGGGAGGDGAPASGGDSLWNHPGDPASAWGRGRAIESAELDRLAADAARKGASLQRMDEMQSGCDALVRDGSGLVEALQVISLNPFLASYRDNAAAVRRSALAALSRMPDPGELVEAPSGMDPHPVGLRHLVLVVPENAPAWIDALARELMGKLSADAAVLSVRRGYGIYDADAVETAPAPGSGQSSGSG